VASPCIGGGGGASLVHDLWSKLRRFDSRERMSSEKGGGGTLHKRRKTPREEASGDWPVRGEGSFCTLFARGFARYTLLGGVSLVWEKGRMGVREFKAFAARVQDSHHGGGVASKETEFLGTIVAKRDEEGLRRKSMPMLVMVSCRLLLWEKCGQHLRQSYRKKGSRINRQGGSEMGAVTKIGVRGDQEGEGMFPGEA